MVGEKVNRMTTRNQFLVAFVLVIASCCSQQVAAFEIVVDYSYDTQNFFNTQQKRDALEAAAARYSRVIDSELLAVGPTVDVVCGDGSVTCPAPWRLGFPHPGEGGQFQSSTAANADDDPIPDAANAYGLEGLEANKWTLYAGGRRLTSAAQGGTATGLNFPDVFEDFEGPFHRGVLPVTANSTNDLPIWGGSVAFNTNTNWHFDLDTPFVPGNGYIDFYSIALHEIGHALGLASPWNQWTHQLDGIYYQGTNAVEAFNADNGTSVTQLRIEATNNFHWADSVEQKSFIFSAGEPNTVGTIGDGLQDLIMDPSLTFTRDNLRFELTNVDVASLEDVGWSVIEDLSDPLDLNGDALVNADDLNLACAAQQPLDEYYAALNTIPGDVDLDGYVQFADFLLLSTYFGTEGNYSRGDITCDGEINFGDFLLLSTQFGRSAAASHAASQSVPEPTSGLAALIAMVVLAAARRRRH